MATNRWRLREPEDVGPERPGPAPRVLWLGDSAAWGWGVADAERYTDLAAAAAGAASVNLAQVGYGTDQEVLLYEREGVRYDADLVVLSFTGSNDLYENLGHGRKPYFELAGGKLHLRNVPAPDRFRGPGRALARGSRLAALLRGRASVLALRLRFREDRREHLSSRGISPEKVMEGWPVTLALLERLRLDVAARGARLAVTALDGEPFGMDRLGAWCGPRGVPFLDLNPAFRDEDPGAVRLRLKDGHLNARGHRHAASVLAPFLRDALRSAWARDPAAPAGTSARPDAGDNVPAP